MKSNEIGKYLYAKLIGDTDVHQLVKERIFPIIAENGTTYPFLTYQRNGGMCIYSKDGMIAEQFSISIDCVHTDYSKCIDVALSVRNVLDNLQEFPVQFQLSSTTEIWLEEGIFMQTLIYDVTITV